MIYIPERENSEETTEYLTIIQKRMSGLSTEDF